MHKHGRPYSCLIIDTHDEYYICIPFRSSITHSQAFLFKNTQRSQGSRSGLDYKKMVLIKDESYFDHTTAAIVDNDEYKEAITNLDRIAREATRYVDDYIAHVSGTKTLHPRAYDRKYRFSTLPYFHDILGLNN
ncbi:MAG: hypothetical protein E7434_04870 [Ruminococcaceae bacterium]|nr:hypothetical protein [Oscillospiraceae bacterium]